MPYLISLGVMHAQIDPIMIDNPRQSLMLRPAWTWTDVVVDVKSPSEALHFQLYVNNWKTKWCGPTAIPTRLVRAC